jgi:hypothetical protein
MSDILISLNISFAANGQGTEGHLLREDEEKRY